jgi:FKBP-type peptidyl-prolyl cis-trans isomerase SlyD
MDLARAARRHKAAPRLDIAGRRGHDAPMISARKVVTIDYVLKNPGGEVLDTSDGAEPLSYIHGAHQIVPGLERALEGLEVGAVKDVVVPAGDGYGEPDPGGIFTIPRASLPPDLSIEVGDTFMGESDDGEAVPVRVVELRDDVVVVDANHPLAGVELHFHVEVRAVRDATLDELTHGAPRPN